MTDYAAVLTELYPGSRWSLFGDDYSGLTWLSDGDAPTQQELDAAWPSVRDARAWAQVRVERDRLLASCDWTQVVDAPLTASAKQAWADYRQALRDIPQEQDDPDSIVWPETP